MRRMRAWGCIVASVVASASVFAACGGDAKVVGSSGSSGSGAGGHSTTTSAAGGANAGGSGGGTFLDAGSCSSNADCNGGVCVAGACCAADAVCGDICCGAGTTCLFGQCVKPGKSCQTQNDCDPGQYCETALGDNPDAGAGGGDGADAGCLEPVPLQGKCLDLPPVCGPNADADAGCLEPCEYHPPVGELNAVAKWTWGPVAGEQPNYTDVWSTPTVGRIYDGNCDGKVDELDAPDVVFVSGKSLDANGFGVNCNNGATGSPNACVTGVLRMLDGRTGQEIWSLAKPAPDSIGFSGISTAIGDVDGDGKLDVVAATGEGRIVLVDAAGNVVRTSDLPIPSLNTSFGWGGGLALADMDGDGHPEIAYGRTVFTTTNGAITLAWTGSGGLGGEGIHTALSAFVDLDGAADNHLELLAGRTAYKADGTILWDRSDIGDGFPAVGDFDKNGSADVVLVRSGKVYILDGATGATVLGPATLPGTGFGGPPTVADFDGDGKPEIGVAQQNFYSVLKPDFGAKALNLLWSTPNHDLSSSVTGSSVFDFEGDGKAEVIYADECFLWVFDGATGAVRFATSHSSWTATEASVVADVDGDGRSEMLMVSNAINTNTWKCVDANQQPTVVNGVKWTPGPAAGKAYRGVALFGDAANSWVGTRTLWNEHTYHVTNICDDHDSACDAPNVYGSIPKVEKQNISLPWLNDFRQNVQDKGIFDAPDATVSLTVTCASPLVAHAAVRNAGLASLPEGVEVAVFDSAAPGVPIAAAVTTHVLFPGQTEVLDIPLQGASQSATFFAQIVVDPNAPKFHECREDNDQSATAKAGCVQ